MYNYSIMNKPINFYELDSVKKFMPKSINPCFDKHHISVPFRSVVIGSSGSGKTNFLLNLIHVMSGTFNHIYIYTQASEPLYDYLQSKLPDDMLTIKYGIQNLIDFDESKYEGQCLVILDDMVNEPKKKQQAIAELYIRGRKLANGLSCIYLTQDFYRVPKIIRGQCNYIFILKVNGVRDLKLILSEYALSATTSVLQQMYEYCCGTTEINAFMTIDLQASQDKTFRKNFDEYLIV
jgi:hypothetical protein